MNGPQHFLEAERLLVLADYDQDHAPQTAATRRTDAQTHATLAQAAATALLAELFATHADVNHSHIDIWDDVVNGPQLEERPPVEEYPGELAHLRDLHTALGKAGETSEAINEFLIAHFSDSQIVDPQLTADEDHDGPSASELHEMDQADEAALDAAADEEFAADTEGQR